MKRFGTEIVPNLFVIQVVEDEIMKTYEDYVEMHVFNDGQLRQLQRGLQRGFDVEIFAKPELDSQEMQKLLRLMMNGHNITPLCDTNVSKHKRSAILQLYEHMFDNPICSDSEIREQIARELDSTSIDNVQLESASVAKGTELNRLSSF